MIRQARTLELRRLGRLDYDEAHDLQKRLVDERRGGDDSGLESEASTVLEVSDLEALVRYFEAHPAGIEAPALGRIHQRDP